MIDYDSELRHHHLALCRALDVQPRDRVLDIGCGTGQTTRHVARIANEGQALGIDTAQSALHNAQEITHSAGMRNVDYVCGDAARLPLPRASVDIAISRFGTMFFADPVSAFTNIRETLHPMGRLIMMVWQSAQHNEWAVAIHRALVGSDTALPESSSAFSLGDEHTVRTVLRSASFVDVVLKPLHAPVYYGPDVETAFAFVAQFSNVAHAAKSQTLRERERTFARLRDSMAAHLAPDGVWFDSRTWIVTARRG